MTLAAAALTLGLTNCGNPEASPPSEWTATVEQDIDNLTGEPTGYYTTWGPSVNVSVHGRSTTVTAGYFCVKGGNGLAVRMAVPLDSVRLRREFAAAAVNTRLAVDRVPIDWTFNHYFTDSTAAVLASPMIAADVPTPSLNDLRTLGSTAYIGWEPYRDEVRDMVAAADSVGFDLGDIGSTVVRFPVDGIVTAIEAVRFWCPVTEMVDSLNAARNNLLTLADSIRGEVERREEARREAAERREEARREAAERREAARRGEAQRWNEDRREWNAANEYARSALTADVSVLLGDMGLTFSGHKYMFLAMAHALDMVPVTSMDDIARVCRADIEAVLIRFRNATRVTAETQQVVRDGCSRVLQGN